MPDLLDFKMRRTGENKPFPQVAMGWRMVQSKDQAIVIEDKRESGGQHILFPDVVATMTQEEQVELMDYIGQWFVNKSMAGKT